MEQVTGNEPLEGLNDVQDRVLRPAAVRAEELVQNPVQSMWTVTGLVIGTAVRLVGEAARDLAEEGWTLQSFAEALLEGADGPGEDA